MAITDAFFMLSLQLSQSRARERTHDRDNSGTIIDDVSSDVLIGSTGEHPWFDQ
jgi:hypothetical protein